MNTELQKKLKILFICSWYPNREHSTIGNFVQRHALALGKYHDVTVVYATESNENHVDRIENEGIIENLIYFTKTLPGLSYQKKLKSFLKKIQQKEKFDIAHIHVAYPAILAVNSLNIPYVITEHFSGYHKVSGYNWGSIKKRLTLKALNNAQAILPVSDHLGKAIKEFGVKNEFFKVSNVVDTSVFYPTQKKPETFTFLHVSSLEERSKNISGLLEGFQKLDEYGFDFVLKIGGDGDLEELNEKIKSAGLAASNIEVFGESSGEEVAKMMRDSHSLVMFSHFENQPCTILEALCCGLPVVSSNVGGIPEEIDSKNGILVDPSSLSDFVQALKSMIQNYGNYDGPNISKTAIAKYSNDSVAHQISAIYSSVLNKDS